MRRKEKLPELLSPAGSFDALIMAVKGGADAVYVGGRAFGARAFAKNFNNDELSDAVLYCHAHGVKIYVTVNTLVYDKEMRELSDYLAFLCEIGVDAVISSDLGVIREARNRCKELPIHASTQMSVHNTYGVDMAHSLGCERVVVARELSLENIKSVVEKSKAQIEVFLHGALCVSSSGQCLMSSLVGGRSGNRGECAQPCRLPYDGKYPLSLKDLSLAEHIPSLIESGVASLKIEGRMKSPSYVYTVTSVYRRLLDEGRCASEKEKKILADAFSRDGFTDGYFTGRLFSPMTGVRSEEDKAKGIACDIEIKKESTPVCMRLSVKRGEGARLTLKNKFGSVTVSGDTPTEAINSPLTADGLYERISKLGGTYLTLRREDFEVELDEGLNLSPGQINSLRRSAVNLLLGRREVLLTEFCEGPRMIGGAQRMRSALFFSADAYRDVCDEPVVKKSIDLSFIPLFDIDEATAPSVGAYIPPIIHDSEMSEVETALARVSALGVKCALVGNIGHISMVKKFGLTPVGDFRLNICNSLAREVCLELGVSDVILSPELTLPMARDITGGVVTLGRIPLMLTERCFIKENFGCDRCSHVSFTDRLGQRFPIIREYKHRNIIFNSQLTYMGDRKKELSTAKITREHFIFSIEGKEEILEYISSYIKEKELSAPVRRMGKRSDKNTKMNKYANKMHKNDYKTGKMHKNKK